MGVSLELLVQDEIFSFTYRMPVSARMVLRFVDSYRIIGQIIDISEYTGESPSIETRLLPEYLTVIDYDDDQGIVYQSMDAYGQPFRYCLVKDLLKLKIPEDAHPINKAIKAFLNELPDDYVVVLRPC